jgi:cob(I)alamin adenosyltransferase
LPKYYTGRGDDGTTGTLAGTRLKKSDKLMEAIGSLDELNSAVGVALSYVDDKLIADQLKSIQNDLFVIGAELASADGKKEVESKLKPDASARLEASIKELGDLMPGLDKFVLPGGSRAAAHLHMARSIARRTERMIVAAAGNYRIGNMVIAYLNRLSSYLFVAALYINFKDRVEELHPTY